MRKKARDGKATNADIYNYAVGEGTNSLANNGIGTFGLVYLTVILGLDPILAGIAISISTFWHAISDPLMGHVSDNTRGRWGRRYPYILFGGLAIAAIFFAYWTLPLLLVGNMKALFAVLLLLNLLFRTAQTVFVVPYTALGFEICPSYEQRAELQGKRWFFNQSLNFVFVALAWPLFFPDGVNAETGETINGSFIGSNYVLMGVVTTIFIVVITLYSSFKTKRFSPDNRDHPKGHNDIKSFFLDFTSIFKDKLAVLVIIFVIVSGFSYGLMAQTQIYTYILFMDFSPWEKSFVHGGGMVVCSLFALLLPSLVRRFDKKPTGYIGMGISILGGVGLWLIFSTGLMGPKDIPFTLFGQPFHVSTIVFGILQMLWWGGVGIVTPLTLSMMADVAAINAKKTGGEVRNASYSSVMSFSQKMSFTVTGLLIAGALKMAGFVSGQEAQAPETIKNIANLTFLSGPAVIVISLVLFMFYPVTRETMEQLSELDDSE